MQEQWATAIDEFLSWLAASGAVPGTVKLRRLYLAKFAAATPAGPWTITNLNLTEFVATFGPSKNTRRSVVASLRTFYRWAHADGRTTRNLAINLPAVRAPRRRKKAAPDSVFYPALARQEHTRRERMMLKLAGYYGLRRAEIAVVRGDELDDDDRLWIIGKGDAERFVPIIDPELLEALRTAGPGYLFPGGADGHVGADWVGKLLKRCLATDKYTGHSLRHRFGTKGFGGEGAPRNIRAVQDLMGHASLNTTQTYTEVDDSVYIEVIRATSRELPNAA